ncbi:nitric oxide synthase oxygenase [Bacillus sp. FJAT-49732]|uniref:Nitric oxide synthase oxygenase n=1 Tax=Lederbergia citrisecunda TaxID=2833583 RepID=A0A942TJQ8_9BACI|nr:nitric oxide synthase oxygenase [Lederbergia citrisecunda]MBS4198895.1 nitric oxide synthase oxygenase [Lederbergia citrisecunda]
MHQDLLKEAEKFINISYHELKKSDQEIKARLLEIKDEINRFGYYKHTFEELEYGAKLAWRNSNRCIGRLFWEKLNVFDMRHLSTEESIAHALLEHIKYATNQGRIRSTITVFHQKTPDQSIKIWNHQLIRYAGYQTENGIIGDPDSLAFTRECEKLGWKGKGSQFDVLPLVVQINDNKPYMIDIPNDLILEVPIHHPEYDWFKDLRIKWYSVPIISSMKLEIGGIVYTASPFNGWYMGTEIGARNLADENRYNILPKISSCMGLDQSKNSSLWKDRALVELNIAVLHSYKENKVSIVDHHTASHQFKQFEENERKMERPLTGNWTWLIPPLAPATSHIFYKQYNNEINKPNYFYQKPPYS